MKLGIDLFGYGHDLWYKVSLSEEGNASILSLKRYEMEQKLKLAFEFGKASPESTLTFNVEIHLTDKSS